MIKEKINSIPIGAKSAIVYTLSSVFSRGLAIITVPIFTRLMSTEQIGIVNLYNSWVGILLVFINLSLTSGGYSAALQEYKNERNQYQSSVLTLTTCMALLFLASYIIMPKFWLNLTGLSKSLLLLMFIGFIFTPAQEFWLLRQRYEYKYKLAGFISIGSALISSILSIIVVLHLKDNPDLLAEGRLFSTNIIMYGIAAFIWLVLMFRGKTFINLDYWKFSLKLSIPLIGYALALQVLNVSDRMMISKMVGNSEVGIYSTLYTVSSLSLLVWSAINSSFIPYLFQNIEKKDNKIKSISTLLMGSYAIIAILLTFFAPEIIKILATGEYYEAIYIMPPIAGGVFLTSVSNMYSNILVYYKKTKYIMISAIIAAIANVGLNFIFISYFGYKAAAYTTLVAYIIMSFLLVYYANKVASSVRNGNYLIYDNKTVLLMSLVSILVCLSCILWYRNIFIRYLFIIIFVIIGYIVIKKALKANKNR